MGEISTFRKVVLICLMCLSTHHVVADDMDAEKTRLGRYTTIITQPTASDTNPLQVLVQIQFPRQQVTSVGDAIRYLLLRTGYTLDHVALPVANVLGKPLPESQRKLGPYSVNTLLQILLPAPYVLHTDPVSRTVAYKLSDPESVGEAEEVL